jgi:hypothetical protein
MKFIHILKDGKMDEIIYTKKKYNEKDLLKYLSKISKSQGSDNIKKLYTWNYQSSKIICYGWYDGHNGFENKHELPQSGISDFIEEDSSLKKLYGDLFILKFKNKYIDLTIGDYSVFYSTMVEDYSDYETDSVSENEILPDEEIDYKIIEEYEIVNNDNFNELEYDNNNY